MKSESPAIATKTVTINLDGKTIWRGHIAQGEVLFNGLRQFTANTDWFHITTPKSPRGRKKVYTDEQKKLVKAMAWKKTYRINREAILQRAKDKRAAAKAAQQDQSK